jgi:hypothetical protein
MGNCHKWMSVHFRKVDEKKLIETYEKSIEVNSKIAVELHAEMTAKTTTALHYKNAGETAAAFEVLKEVQGLTQKWQKKNKLLENLRTKLDSISSYDDDEEQQKLAMDTSILLKKKTKRIAGQMPVDLVGDIGNLHSVASGRINPDETELIKTITDSTSGVASPTLTIQQMYEQLGKTTSQINHDKNKHTNINNYSKVNDTNNNNSSTQSTKHSTSVLNSVLSKTV